MQHTTERDAARLTRDPADDEQPTLSPDGSRVVFRSDRDGGGLYVVPTLGGRSASSRMAGELPRFSPDGSQIAFLRDVGFTPRGLLPVFLVPAEGGTPRPFQPDFGVPDLPGSAGPIWSPDGRHILFRGFRLKPPGEDGSRPGDWLVAPVDGGPAVATGAAAAWPRRDTVQLPCAWVGQHILMAAGTTMEGVNLYRVRIGADFRVSGPPEPLTSGTGISHLASVSQDGRLVVPRWSGLVQLVVDPEHRQARRCRRRSLATARRSTLSRSIGEAIGSPTRPWPAPWVDIGWRSGSASWRAARTGTSAPVPTSISVRPRLSPDGALLAWEEFADGKFVSFVGKTGEPSGQELCRDCRLLGFASDGRASSSGRARGGSSCATSRPEETPAFEPEAGALIDADLSWDDRWLAILVAVRTATVASRRSRLRKARRPAPGPSRSRARTVALRARDGRRTGRRIYTWVRDGFLCIWAQAVDRARGAARRAVRGLPRAPQPLAHGRPARGFSLFVGPRRAWSSTRSS